MAVYSVSYDLMAPGQNYDDLCDELRESPGWWHYLESTWLIATRESANELARRLLNVIDENDRLLVIGVDQHYQGWLPKEAWDWINQHVGVSIDGISSVL